MIKILCLSHHFLGGAQPSGWYWLPGQEEIAYQLKTKGVNWRWAGHLVDPDRYYDYLEFTFPESMSDEALVFKLTWGGR